MVAQHQPDLHMPAATAQICDRIETGRRVTERIDGDISAIAGFFAETMLDLEEARLQQMDTGGRPE